MKISKHITTRLSRRPVRLLALLMASILAIILPAPADARSLHYDCTQWAIMYCGTWDGTQNTMKQFELNYQKDAPGDLHTIYADYGLHSADQLQNYKTGTIDSNGTLTVDGNTVATNVRTIGRNGSADGRPTTTKTIGGKVYAEEAASDVIKTYSKYGVDSLDAYVLMDGTTPSFAIVTACGNPISFTPQPPRQQPDASPSPTPTPTTSQVQQLPSTGPNDPVSTTLGVGSLVAAGGYFVQSRRERQRMARGSGKHK